MCCPLVIWLEPRMKQINWYYCLNHSLVLSLHTQQLQQVFYHSYLHWFGNKHAEQRKKRLKWIKFIRSIVATILTLINCTVNWDTGWSLSLIALIWTLIVWPGVYPPNGTRTLMSNGFDLKQHNKQHLLNTLCSSAITGSGS